ncbi:MAG: hypothetical protein U9R49_09660 [Bacteroidota bacterium]|nr:hypothetical protein [Bacteroidota bacterium]
MQTELRKKQRKREILAGLMIILAVSSYITSLLLDFNFVSPFATLQEDLSYLSNHVRNLQISVWAWLGTSLITFLAIPPFLLVFHKRLKVFHYVNGIWLLGASAGFLMMGISGIELYQELTRGVLSSMNETDEEIWIRLLGLFHDEQFYRRIGSSFVGLFAVGLGLIRFKMRRVPIVTTVLLFICGPTMIFFNWYDPEHLIRTAAMAGIVIGVTIFSVRVINKGLEENREALTP